MWQTLSSASGRDDIYPVSDGHDSWDIVQHHVWDLAALRISGLVRQHDARQTPALVVPGDPKDIQPGWVIVGLKQDLAGHEPDCISGGVPATRGLFGS